MADLPGILVSTPGTLQSNDVADWITIGLPSPTEFEGVQTGNQYQVGTLTDNQVPHPPVGYL